jgi:hypothetical protein
LLPSSGVGVIGLSLLGVRHLTAKGALMHKRIAIAAIAVAVFGLGVGSAIAQSGGGPGGTTERGPIAEPKGTSSSAAPAAKKQSRKPLPRRTVVSPVARPVHERHQSYRR